MADKTLPSLIGVSTPLERKNATTTTAKNNPDEVNALFILALSFAKPESEKARVTMTAIRSTN